MSSNKRTAWLPIDKARKFAVGKGFEAESKFIEEKINDMASKAELGTSNQLDYKRALHMKLFQFRKVWEDFIRDHWQDANKPEGKKSCEKYEKRATEVFKRYPEVEALLKRPKPEELVTPTGKPEPIMISLTPGQKAQLEKLAVEYGTDASTLARIWILERLRQLRSQGQQ